MHPTIVFDLDGTLVDSNPIDSADKKIDTDPQSTFSDYSGRI
jgi:phosphoglycolate phosphatase-like HAD superfamily hydrolase